MAHADFQIPLSFDFRKVAVRWSRVPAEFLGWAVAADGSEDHTHLLAQIEADGEKREIKLPLSDFLQQEQKHILGVAGRPAQDSQQVLTSIGLAVFLPDRHLPVADPELKKHSQPADAWQMREDFLGLTSDLKRVEAFLNKWGRWHNLRGFAEAREMLSLQRAVKDALISSPDHWFETGHGYLPALRSNAPTFPYFSLVTDSCREAIRVATTVDLLRRSEFKPCAREDCGRPFQISSKHKKDYCTTYCAHLVSVRRNRRQKSATLKKGATA